MRILLGALLLGLTLQASVLAAEVETPKVERVSPSSDEKNSNYTFPQFLLDYLIIEGNLKGNKGLSKEFAKLMEQNPERGEFLATFWWVNSNMECGQFIEDTVKMAVDSRSEKTRASLFGQIPYCRYAYYFNNWDAINQTIKDAGKVRIKNKK